MANRFPLIANSSSNQIQELANADNLDLTGNNIVGLVNIASTGIVTATSFSGNIEGNVTGNISGTTGTFTGDVSIGGTLTYEDVTNIDSVGIITAREGVISPSYAGHSYIQAPFGTTQNFSVTVAAKTAAHRYQVSGSGNGYVIDGVEAPFLTLTPGRTYRFTLSASDMTNHPFRFYLEADKTTPYTTNVTSTATYTEIIVTDSTPQVLHYQCSAHGLMGNSVNTNSGAVITGDTATFYGGLTTQKLLKEEVNITAGKLSDNLNIYLENGCVHVFTVAESTTSTPAIKYSSGVNLKDMMSVGESVVVTLITTANASAYSANITIDGDAVTENWVGGSAPSDGGSSGVDIHSFTIIKVASSGTTDQQLTVIGNHSKTS